MVLALYCFSHHHQLVLLFANSEGIEAHLDHRLVALFLEAKDAHVGGKHEFTVLVRLLPGLDVSAKPIETLPSHVKQDEAHLIERDPLQLGLSELSRQYMQARLALQPKTIIVPLLPGTSEFVGVCLPHQLLAPLVPESRVVDFVPPDGKGSLHVLPAVPNFCVPDSVESLVLRSVDTVRIQLLSPPHVEHVG